jgi:hypothetical protein
MKKVAFGLIVLVTLFLFFGCTDSNAQSVSKFDSYLEKYKSSVYTANYSITSDAITTFSAGYIIYNDNKNNLLRVDGIMNDKEIGRIFFLNPSTNTGIVTCAINAAKWNCIANIDKNKSYLLPFDPVNLKVTSKVSSTSSDVILGESVECFDFQNVVKNISGQICFTFDGVPLKYFDNLSGHKNSMVATNITRSVNQSDFNPPASVNQILGPQ